MDNVGGVFLVLCGGLVVAILVGIGEFIWCIRRTSIDEKVNEHEKKLDIQTRKKTSFKNKFA